jgi:hypothetical protein
MSKLDALLDRLKNDIHVPVALLIFSVTSIFHFWKHADLGANYTNSLYALYAFLGGHSFVTGKFGNGNGNGTSDSSGNGTSQTPQA